MGFLCTLYRMKKRSKRSKGSKRRDGWRRRRRSSKKMNWESQRFVKRLRIRNDMARNREMKAKR